mgnify:FL=1
MTIATRSSVVDAVTAVDTTFGTVFGHMSTAVEGLKVLLAAVAQVDAKVLLTTGLQVDPTALGPTPPNVVVERWVDHASVVAAASAVVCHGGSATLIGTLAAGLPLVVVPLFADQFSNAEMVTASGVGLAVDRGADGRREPLGSADVEAIRSAVEQVLRDESVGAAAQKVATEMAAAPCADEALDDSIG